MSPENFLSFPSEELIDETKVLFTQSEPLYRLPEVVDGVEIGDSNYYAYTVEDAAHDILEAHGVTFQDPDYRYKIEALSEAARREINNVEVITKMRFRLQHLLNEARIDQPVDQQG